MVGQTWRYTFSGTAGQNLGLGFSGLSLTPASGSYTRIYVYRPDGTSITYADCYTSNPGAACESNLVNLPTTGTYSVVVTPPDTTTSASATMTASTDVTGTLTAGTPYALSLPRSGQNARLTFSGTAGQQMGIGLSSVTVTPNTTGVLTVYKPDGTTLGSSLTFSNGAIARLDPPVLPVSGTYTVFISPYYAATASMNVSLSEDAGGALTVDGASITSSLSMVGQTWRYTFSGTAGQNLGLGFSGLSLTPSSSSVTWMYVYRPDGATVTWADCYTSLGGGGCDAELTNLPTTGTYSVVVTPPATTTSASATMTASTEATGTLTIDGAAMNVNLSRAGQDGRYTFSGTSGQNLRLAASGLSTSPSGQSVYFKVLKPDGTNFSAITSAGPTMSLDIATLPTTGTYQVVIDPNYAAATSSFSLTLTTR
jgi:hypothetical protein